MNLDNFRDRYLLKRVRALEKYKYLRNKFINRKAEAERDSSECRKIINELKEKLKWDGTIP